MGLRTAVARSNRQLTKSEQKVVEILLQDLRNTVFLPAADVADLAGVHESTVVRLAQKLGYSGYSGLRNAMREDIKELDARHSRLVKLTDERGYDFEALVLAEAQALMRLPDHISQTDLDHAAGVLLQSNHVHILGNHFAAPLTTFLDRRLRLVGFRTSTTAGVDARSLAEHVGSIRQGDVVFAFALRREPAGLSEVLTQAREVGAKSIVLTDVLGLSLSAPVTQVLAAPRSADDDFRTQVIPHLICYALQLSLYHLAPERCERALDSIDSLAQAISPNAKPNVRPRVFQQLMDAESEERL